MIDGKPWIAMFSHTGSEIVSISKKLGIIPEKVITNNAPGSPDINKQLLSFHIQPNVVNEIVYNSKIVLDHCHDTESFRGWICYACNQGIGKLGDNLEGVVKAALYLSNNNINLILKTIEKIKT